MNLHIPLSPEAEAKLREQAMAAGMDVESFVLDALQQKLGSLTSPKTNGDSSKPRCELIGLFADEPEVIDEIMDAAYENRTRPLRLE